MITPSKPRIVFLLPSLAAGGAERVMITLINSTDRAAYFPALIDMADGGGALRGIVAADIPVYALGAKSPLRGIFKLYRALKTNRPDVVVSTMAPMNFCVLLLRPFFPEIKFIVRESTDPVFVLGEKPHLAPLIRLAYKILYPRADAVIAPAQKILGRYRDDLKIKNLRGAFLPNPLDVKKIRAHIGGAAQKTSRLQFVAVGRLHPHKGFDRLIDVAAALPADFDYHIKIIGDGPARDALADQIVAKKISARITLAGHHENPWAAMADADALVMPSRVEGMPNAALEALALGVHVIAHADAGGIHEVAHHAKPGAVMIAQNMNEFGDFMMNASMHETDAPRDSLLPEIYDHERVMRAFEKILRDVLTQK